LTRTKPPIMDLTEPRAILTKGNTGGCYLYIGQREKDRGGTLKRVRTLKGSNAGCSGPEGPGRDAVTAIGNPSSRRKSGVKERCSH